MASDSILTALAPWLLQSTLALTLGLVVVYSLRVPLRRAFGARIAYAAWWLAPACLLAPLLPMPAQAPRVFAFAGNAAVAMPALFVPAAAAAGDGPDVRMLIVLAWAFGAIGMAVLFARRQRGFERNILRRPEQGWDEVAGHGPAVAGLLQPRILLPRDFDARYTRHEQLLVLAHERLHVLRGDVVAQACASALRCVFWFHPLVHAAAATFRFDQELACDADVLARFPGSRRAYGDAMLKTQLAVAGLPLGCHWQSSHPLKERLTMLKQPTPGALRRHAGRAVVGLVLAVGAWAAWAAKPAPTLHPGAPIAVQFRISVDGAPAVSTWVVAGEGEMFYVRHGQGADQVELTLTATRTPHHHIALRGSVRRAGRELFRPDLDLVDGADLLPPRPLPDGLDVGVLWQAAARSLAPGEPVGANGPGPALAAATAGSAAAVPWLTRITDQDDVSPPIYPKAALKQGLQGKLTLELYSDTEGNVREVRVVKADPPGVFDAAAIEAASKWHVTPGRDANGKPQAGWSRTEVAFTSDAPPKG